MISTKTGFGSDTDTIFQKQAQILNPNHKLLNPNQLCLYVLFLSLDHFNQLCSNEGKIVQVQVLLYEAEYTLPECVVPIWALSFL